MSASSNITIPTTSTDGVQISAGSGGQGHQIASGIKGVFAKIHGAGEEIRGTFNQGVDEAFHESEGPEMLSDALLHDHMLTHMSGTKPEGVVKNQAVAQSGRNEMETGNFAEATKVREGVIPGVVGTRSNRST